MCACVCVCVCVRAYVCVFLASQFDAFFHESLFLLLYFMHAVSKVCLARPLCLLRKPLDGPG